MLSRIDDPFPGVPPGIFQPIFPLKGMPVERIGSVALTSTRHPTQVSAKILLDITSLALFTMHTALKGM